MQIENQGGNCGRFNQRLNGNKLKLQTSICTEAICEILMYQTLSAPNRWFINKVETTTICLKVG